MFTFAIKEVSHSIVSQNFLPDLLDLHVIMTHMGP